jgi:hypothetical protein
MQDIDGQCGTYRWSKLSISSKPDLYTAERGLQNLYDYFVQCCGSEIIFFGSGSGSYLDLNSGSGVFMKNTL